jgi:exodeoxyribonuclease VII large subunit
MENEILTVSQFHGLLNQTLEFAYPEVVVEGEVASYKVNQGKWVFFDIKDDVATLSCFMPIFQLKTVLEDGMLVRIHCVPKLTAWGKFSLTVKSLELAGEGSVKKAFELLKAQFEREGLFAAERKRLLPQFPKHVALITSAQAAAYNDFVTILTQRYHAMKIDHMQVQVQGESASDQLVRAIEYCSRQGDYDVVVVIRGGGSAEDLQAFNTEPVVRAIYGCSIPTLVGIGHEDDVSLAELVADMRAATPTDAARRLSPELDPIIVSIDQHVNTGYDQVKRLLLQASHVLARSEQVMSYKLSGISKHIADTTARMVRALESKIIESNLHIASLQRSLTALNPRAILKRGYSIASINGQVVTSVTQITQSSVVMLQLHQGNVRLQKATKLLTRKSRPSHDQPQIKF